MLRFYLTDEQRQRLHAMIDRARAAMKAIEGYDEARINRLCRLLADLSFTTKLSCPRPKFFVRDDLPGL